jgi:hypothetical protein
MTDYEMLMNTASQCSIKIITDDFCCKLLAWLYMFGAETEMVVYNVVLRTDIQEAQKRLNVLGGEVPNNALCNKMREYIKECGEYFNLIRPKWVDEIDSKYGITTKGAIK